MRAGPLGQSRHSPKEGVSEKEKALMRAGQHGFNQTVCWAGKMALAAVLSGMEKVSARIPDNGCWSLTPLAGVESHNGASSHAPYFAIQRGTVAADQPAL